MKAPMHASWEGLPRESLINGNLWGSLRVLRDLEGGDA